MESKRYWVYAYHNECGADHGMDFSNLKDARAWVNRKLSERTEDEKEYCWESAFILDTADANHTVCLEAYNGLPSSIFTSSVDCEKCRYIWDYRPKARKQKRETWTYCIPAKG